MIEYTKILNDIGPVLSTKHSYINSQKLKLIGHANAVFVSSNLSFYLINQSKILETSFFSFV
jgi:hypothetical protein